VKALVWTGPKQMEVEDKEQPRAEPGAVVVRSRAAGICGSEIEGYLGRMANRTPPLVMGHEFAGEVVELGSGVDESWKGKQVAINPVVSCGVCAACRAGDTNLCEKRALIGIAFPGGFAEYVNVPVASLYELPAGTDPRVGALVEPMANGVHAVRLGLHVVPAERAAVIGGGMIGLACLQAALAQGIETVDLVEPHPARREHARDLGAHAVHASAAEAGAGFDLVIDAVGAGATRQGAVEMTRNGGACVFIGLHEDSTPLTWHRVIRSQIAIRGTFAYSRDDFQVALEQLVAGRTGIGELSEPLPIGEGPKAFADLASGPSRTVKVFLTS
jgi:2-desacetyl-2-hydroxyethyl bacteriochlorophyllide A dehydrogenase